MDETESAKNDFLHFFAGACEVLADDENLVYEAAEMGVMAEWMANGSLRVYIPAGPLTETVRRSLFGSSDSSGFVAQALRAIFGWPEGRPEPLEKMYGRLEEVRPKRWPGSLKPEDNPRWQLLEKAIGSADYYCDTPALKRAMRAYERFIKRAYDKWRASGLEK